MLVDSAIVSIYFFIILTFNLYFPAAVISSI